MSTEQMEQSSLARCHCNRCAGSQPWQRSTVPHEQPTLENLRQPPPPLATAPGRAPALNMQCCLRAWDTSADQRGLVCSDSTCPTTIRVALQRGRGAHDMLCRFSEGREVAQGCTPVPARGPETSKTAPGAREAHH